MNHEFAQVELFRSQLQAGCKDFICASSLPDLCVTVSFLGVFKGETVLWQMTLATLQYWMSRDSKVATVANSDLFNAPFIEIAEGEMGIYQIGVGLELDFIDEAVIKKTIIMIRNYKRLALGRSGFGSRQT
jgi:hypothetical protein